jgi:hypothetical protein
VTRPKWKLHSVHLEIVLILTRDRCTVCAERNMDSNVVLDTPDGTPYCVGHVESHVSPFGDSVSVGVG